MKRALLAVLLAAAALPVLAAPAGAAARVSIGNGSGAAVVDPTYATTLTLRGRGFQSIRNGYGGIYVLFGVVKGDWRPSKGGDSGIDYLTVPDAESKDNAGYAKFIAFPGSETAGSANGGLIHPDGTWSTQLTVPGGTFQTTDANQKLVTVDCRTSVCGVITIGAHGVANARNETFTRVRVGKVARTPDVALRDGAGAPPQGPQVGAPPQGARTATAPALEVDRASAKPGRVLSFSAVGLTPGSQVSATFADGEAAVGPLTVGAAGQVAGVLRLPAGLSTGTYELRIVGGEDPPAVRFAVVAAPAQKAPGTSRRPLVFAGAGAVVLAGAVVFAGVRRRRRAR